MEKHTMRLEESQLHQLVLETLGQIIHCHEPEHDYQLTMEIESGKYYP